MKMFEEQFPSLKGKIMWNPVVGDVLTTTTILKEHCLDKRRVREAIHKILFDKYCDDVDNQEHRLLRELGLDEVEK
jgi:DNA-binding protein Fis